jgi:hypothetical protein
MHESGHARGRRGGSLLEQPVRTTCKPPPARSGCVWLSVMPRVSYSYSRARGAHTLI